VTKADLGVNVILETVFIPPRDFMMGSTPEENVGSRALKGGLNEINDGEGRLNISAVDFLPGPTLRWPFGSAPLSHGWAFVSSVDPYGEKGRSEDDAISFLRIGRPSRIEHCICVKRAV